MASRKRITSGYRTYGSVAYAPAFDGSAAPLPREEQRTAPRRNVKRQTEEKALTRTQVQVRQAGAVAPFAVIGFLAVGVFAALLMYSYAQFTVLNDQLFTARSDLAALETEFSTLSAQYEQVFDMERIQAAVGDTMVRPTQDQVVYLDLSAPDAVTVYKHDGGSGLTALAEGAKNLVGQVIEYFR